MESKDINEGSLDEGRLSTLRAQLALQEIRKVLSARQSGGERYNTGDIIDESSTETERTSIGISEKKSPILPGDIARISELTYLLKQMYRSHSKPSTPNYETSPASLSSNRSSVSSLDSQTPVNTGLFPAMGRAERSAEKLKFSDIDKKHLKISSRYSSAATWEKARSIPIEKVDIERKEKRKSEPVSEDEEIDEEEKVKQFLLKARDLSIGVQDGVLSGDIGMPCGKQRSPGFTVPITPPVIRYVKVNYLPDKSITPVLENEDIKNASEKSEAEFHCTDISEPVLSFSSSPDGSDAACIAQNNRFKVSPVADMALESPDISCVSKIIDKDELVRSQDSKEPFVRSDDLRQISNVHGKSGRLDADNLRAIKPASSVEASAANLFSISAEMAIIPPTSTILSSCMAVSGSVSISSIEMVASPSLSISETCVFSEHRPHSMERSPISSPSRKGLDPLAGQPAPLRSLLSRNVSTTESAITVSPNDISYGMDVTTSNLLSMVSSSSMVQDRELITGPSHTQPLSNSQQSMLQNGSLSCVAKNIEINDIPSFPSPISVSSPPLVQKKSSLSVLEDAENLIIPSVQPLITVPTPPTLVQQRPTSCTANEEGFAAITSPSLPTVQKGSTSAIAKDREAAAFSSLRRPSSPPPSPPQLIQPHTPSSQILSPTLPASFYSYQNSLQSTSVPVTSVTASSKYIISSSVVAVSSVPFTGYSYQRSRNEPIANDSTQCRPITKPSKAVVNKGAKPLPTMNELKSKADTTNVTVKSSKFLVSPVLVSSNTFLSNASTSGSISTTAASISTGDENRYCNEGRDNSSPSGTQLQSSSFSKLKRSPPPPVPKRSASTALSMLPTLCKTDPQNHCENRDSSSAGTLQDEQAKNTLIMKVVGGDDQIKEDRPISLDCGQFPKLSHSMPACESQAAAPQPAVLSLEMESTGYNPKYSNHSQRFHTVSDDTISPKAASASHRNEDLSLKFMNLKNISLVNETNNNLNYDVDNSYSQIIKDSNNTYETPQSFGISSFRHSNEPNNSATKLNSFISFNATSQSNSFNDKNHNNDDERSNVSTATGFHRRVFGVVGSPRGIRRRCDTPPPTRRFSDADYVDDSPDSNFNLSKVGFIDDSPLPSAISEEEKCKFSIEEAKSQAESQKEISVSSISSKTSSLEMAISSSFVLPKPFQSPPQLTDSGPSTNSPIDYPALQNESQSTKQEIGQAIVSLIEDTVYPSDPRDAARPCTQSGMMSLLFKPSKSKPQMKHRETCSEGIERRRRRENDDERDEFERTSHREEEFFPRNSELKIGSEGFKCESGLDPKYRMEENLMSPRERELRMGILTNGKRARSSRLRSEKRRVTFDPLFLLLNAAAEGDLEVVMSAIPKLSNPNQCIGNKFTALHTSICNGRTQVAKYLIDYGCDVNALDMDGWTPLHCAAASSNIELVELLIQRGAGLYSTTNTDRETPLQKSAKNVAISANAAKCFDILRDSCKALRIYNNGIVYAAWPYQASRNDELTFNAGDKLKIISRSNSVNVTSSSAASEDSEEQDDEDDDWWSASLGDKEGLVPRNLLALNPCIGPVKTRSSPSQSLLEKDL